MGPLSLVIVVLGIILLVYVISNNIGSVQKASTKRSGTPNSAKVYSQQEIVHLKAHGIHAGPGIERNAYRYLQHYYVSRMRPGYHLAGPFERGNEDVFQVLNANNQWVVEFGNYTDRNGFFARTSDGQRIVSEHKGGIEQFVMGELGIKGYA
ncbi:MAG TPA: hypothetical protein VN838_12700 [Bradyrhizobium sp.]|nr:hypothetical protein [Bradyrhizobium sp.]